MGMVEPMIAELDQEGATTRRLLERVPSDKLTWKPHAKSMTLGVLALHVATIPGGIAGLAHADSFEFTDAPPAPQPDSTDAIVAAHDESLATAKQQVSAMDDAKAMGMWRGTVGGKTALEIPRIGLLRALMLNHWYHHRGQLSVYLRELDVPLPSIYGPSADENPFAPGN